MKRLFVIAFLFILVHTLIFAQSKQNEFDKLVDYVNCKYALDYIDKKKPEITNTNYLNDFEKYKKAFENIVKSYEDIEKGYDQKNPKSSSVYTVLRKSSRGFPKAEALWKYIDNKKADFDEVWTKDQIIDFLVILSDNEVEVSGKKINFKSYLNKTSELLKSDLKSKIPENLFATEKIRNENTQLIDPVKEEEPDRIISSINNVVADNNSVIKQNTDNARIRKRNITDRNKPGLPFGKIFLILILAAIVFLGYHYRRHLNRIINRTNLEPVNLNNNERLNYQKRIEELEIENKRLKDFEKGNSELRVRVKQLELKILEYERQNKNKTELFNRQTQPQTDTSLENEKKQIKSDLIHLYADAIIEGEFHKTNEQPTEDTVYELLKPSLSRVAEFIIYPGAYKRVIETPDFLDGCEKQKINANPRTLDVENGEAIRNDLGKWEVTKKAKIKFI